MKKLLILVLILASTMGCFMRTTMTASIPVTLPNGQVQILTVSFSRMPFADTTAALNPVTGVITLGVNTSPQLSQTIQDLGMLALTSATMFGTPAPQPGPLKQRMPTSISGN